VLVGDALFDSFEQAMSQLRLIVICTGNSCRSQMAEAWFNHLGPEAIKAVSAGSKPAGYVHPLAIEVMGELGISLEDNVSKSMLQFVQQEFDFVITVCDDAAESCPVFPGPGVRLHWPFEDPAKFSGTEVEARQVFRSTRDLIRQKIEEFLQEISPSEE
jgi:arsenate reductase